MVSQAKSKAVMKSKASKHLFSATIIHSMEMMICLNELISSFCNRNYDSWGSEAGGSK